MLELWSGLENLHTAHSYDQREATLDLELRRFISRIEERFVRGGGRVCLLSNLSITVLTPTLPQKEDIMRAMLLIVVLIGTILAVFDASFRAAAEVWGITAAAGLSVGFRVVWRRFGGQYLTNRGHQQLIINKLTSQLLTNSQGSIFGVCEGLAVASVMLEGTHLYPVQVTVIHGICYVYLKYVSILFIYGCVLAN